MAYPKTSSHFAKFPSSGNYKFRNKNKFKKFTIIKKKLLSTKTQFCFAISTKNIHANKVMNGLLT